MIHLASNSRLNITCLLVGLLSCFATTLRAQPNNYIVHNLSLPSELSYYDNQFSGLYTHQGLLYLMSESRLQDKAEGKLYTIRLSDIDRKLTDTSFILPYKKIPLTHLEQLKNKINAAGQTYEGLEAIVIKGDLVFLSVETDTPSPNCYLLQGKLTDAEVLLDTTVLITLPKPLDADGSHIYNAGFEAIASQHKSILAFFEYNYFTPKNEVLAVPLKKQKARQQWPIQSLPFRITDITKTSKHRYTAINFFYKGEGKDTIYRVPLTDTLNHSLTFSNGAYHSYARLIQLQVTGKSFSWKPLWELPKAYWDHNWEGIAAYKKGYFLMNDKYTASRPYQSVLLYLQKK